MSVRRIDDVGIFLHVNILCETTNPAKIDILAAKGHHMQATISMPAQKIMTMFTPNCPGNMRRITRTHDLICNQDSVATTDPGNMRRMTRTFDLICNQDLGRNY